MSTSIRNYFRRLAEGGEDGLLAKCLYPVLGISAAAYGMAIKTVRFLYERKVFPRHKLPFPVISVGNLSWGGTGKTPFVEYLTRRLRDRGLAPLILTRGYGRDEVGQIRHHLPDTLIGVGRNRYRTARRMADTHKIDIAILDDGFQHWPLKRDLEIVTLNTLNPFGNGRLLPLGILREPTSILRKADVIMMTHTNLVSSSELEKLKDQIKKSAPQALAVESYLEPLFFYRARKKVRVPLNKLQNQKVTTFSAVGTPRSFQLLLSRLQIKPVRNFEFTDHHVFSEKELREIKEVSESSSVSEVITTEKDFYRCPEAIANILNPLVLATRLRLSWGEEPLMGKIFRLFEVSRS